VGHFIFTPYLDKICLRESSDTNGCGAGKQKAQDPWYSRKNWHTPCLISQQKPLLGVELSESLAAHLFSLTRLLVPSENLG